MSYYLSCVRRVTLLFLMAMSACSGSEEHGASVKVPCALNDAGTSVRAYWNIGTTDPARIHPLLVSDSEGFKVEVDVFYIYGNVAQVDCSTRADYVIFEVL